MKKTKKQGGAIKKQLQRVSLMLILAVIVFFVLWIAILLAMLLVTLMVRFHRKNKKAAHFIKRAAL